MPDCGPVLVAKRCKGTEDVFLSYDPSQACLDESSSETAASVEPLGDDAWCIISELRRILQERLLSARCAWDDCVWGGIRQSTVGSSTLETIV